jgi:hypothetical protein
MFPSEPSDGKTIFKNSTALNKLISSKVYDMLVANDVINAEISRKSHKSRVAISTTFLTLTVMKDLMPTCS